MNVQMSFLRKICNYKQIFVAIPTLSVKVYILNYLRTKKLIRQINIYLEKYQYSVSSTQVKRIQFYTMQSCITNSWFCTLRGKAPNTNETINALYLGALTPLLDDLVDSTGLFSKQIMDKLTIPEKAIESNEFLIIRYLYNKLIESKNSVFIQAFLRAMESQDESLKQLQQERLEPGKLLEITKNKGVYWTLLYRSALNHSMLPGEEQCIRTLGELLQLTNDAFDVYKDFKKWQQTIFTNTGNIDLIYKQFKNECKMLIICFMELNYPYRQKKKAVVQMLIILSRGLVCMEQLIRCQQKTGNVFKVELYNREELVCDMENRKNIFRSIQICSNYMIALNQYLSKKTI